MRREQLRYFLVTDFAAKQYPSALLRLSFPLDTSLSDLTVSHSGEKSELHTEAPFAPLCRGTGFSLKYLILDAATAPCPGGNDFTSV